MKKTNNKNSRWHFYDQRQAKLLSMQRVLIDIGTCFIEPYHAKTVSFFFHSNFLNSLHTSSAHPAHETLLLSIFS